MAALGAVCGIALPYLAIQLLIGSLAPALLAGAGIVGAARGLLLGLGAYESDRRLPARPRPVRWALGMGLACLVPGLGLCLFLASPAAALAAAAGAAVSALSIACLGLLLGSAVRPDPALLWRMSAVGFAGGTFAFLTAAACTWLWPSGGPYGGSPLFLMFALSPTPFEGAFIGLALAERLRSALQAAGWTEAA